VTLDGGSSKTHSSCRRPRRQGARSMAAACGSRATGRRSVKRSAGDDRVREPTARLESCSTSACPGAAGFSAPVRRARAWERAHHLVSAFVQRNARGAGGQGRRVLALPKPCFREEWIESVTTCSRVQPTWVLSVTSTRGDRTAAEGRHVAGQPRGPPSPRSDKVLPVLRPSAALHGLRLPLARASTAPLRRPDTRK